MADRETILARVREVIAGFGATGGTLQVKRLDRARDGLDFFNLGLDYPNRRSICLECPRDLERMLMAYVDATKDIGGLTITVTPSHTGFEDMPIPAVISREQRQQDYLALQRMRDDNKKRFTGHPLDGPYDPHSTTPVVSNEQLREFEENLAKKYGISRDRLNTLWEH